MMLQSTMFEQQKIDLSSAPWTMHEFFAGSGLVAYGLRGMFAPVWANDISEQKATVYAVTFMQHHNMMSFLPLPVMVASLMMPPQ